MDYQDISVTVAPRREVPGDRAFQTRLPPSLASNINLQFPGIHRHCQLVRLPAQDLPERTPRAYLEDDPRPHTLPGYMPPGSHMNGAWRAQADVEWRSVAFSSNCPN